MLIHAAMNSYFADKEKRKFTVSTLVKREVFGFLCKALAQSVGCYSMYLLSTLLEPYRVKKHNIALADQHAHASYNF